MNAHTSPNTRRKMLIMNNTLSSLRPDFAKASELCALMAQNRDDILARDYLFNVVSRHTDRRF